MSGNSRRNGPRRFEPGRSGTSRSPGTTLTAARACAGALFAAVLAAGLPGATQAQETLTPAQKAKKVLYGYERYGGKSSYGSVTEKNGVLTIRNLKYAIALPSGAVDKPGAPKKTVTMTFTVETVSVRRYDYRNPELPQFADVTFTGMRFGGSMFDTPELRSAFAVFGRHDLVVDFLQTYELDPAAGSIDQTAGTVTMRGLMRADLTGRFDGLDFARLTDPELPEKLGLGGTGSTLPDAAGRMILDLLGEMRIHRLSYGMTDLGGFDKAMAAMAAAQSKKNPDGPKLTGPMMRQALAGALAGMISGFTGSFAPKMLGATARWLLAPGTLTIALRPGEPLPVTRIAGFVAAFSASANQAKGQQIDLDPLQKLLGLSISYTPSPR